ncbi:DUF1266 domain-containing protein [Streptomyces sp. NPDC048718]|uniref:DUF1266 domain-containing protein n=1 Tax=Streptomyces sp. NPDC048718 TaxID=3365587 RepID=UPI003713B944
MTKSPSPIPPAWYPPSSIEHGLHQARLRGDVSAYYDLVAQADLYLAQPRAYADANPDSSQFAPRWNPRTRTMCIDVYTAGMLPLPVPDPVFKAHSLAWFAEVWDFGDPPYLIVNPGSPCEGVLHAGPEGRAHWLASDARRQRPVGMPQPGVHTLMVGGALHGEVAFGLATGAHIFVNNAEFWNSMAYHGAGYTREKEMLEEWWGVTTRTKWLEYVDQLLRADMVSELWEYALGLRHTTGPLTPDEWHEAADRALQVRHVGASAAYLHRTIDSIVTYETRFRADGFLAGDAIVRTVKAWDYGRASAMARWGVSTRLGTLAEAEVAVHRAGRLVHSTYTSWADFSAAYALGRCLHFDEGEFGKWYDSILATHRLLTTDPTSPWLNLPWV